MIHVAKNALGRSDKVLVLVDEIPSHVPSAIRMTMYLNYCHTGTTEDPACPTSGVFCSDQKDQSRRDRQRVHYYSMLLRSFTVCELLV